MDAKRMKIGMKVTREMDGFEVPATIVGINPVEQTALVMDGWTVEPGRQTEWVAAVELMPVLS